MLCCSCGPAGCLQWTQCYNEEILGVKSQNWLKFSLGISLALMHPSCLLWPALEGGYWQVSLFTFSRWYSSFRTIFISWQKYKKFPVLQITLSLHGKILLSLFVEENSFQECNFQKCQTVPKRQTFFIHVITFRTDSMLNKKDND